ncbi:hypothetical protein MMC08_004979 [Hypocenomyce scalaris]|nr:hypothetical protein [Hypocenomyce scalaris]
MSFPLSSLDQTFVRVSPLEGGKLTLPKKFFIDGAEPNARKTVPTLAFLIEHPSAHVFGDEEGSTERPCRLLFDLGLRADLSGYTPAQQSHLKTREPMQYQPGVLSHLAKGGLAPADIEAVILSHVHWDHHGDPLEYTRSKFIVGHGTLDLLSDGLPGAGSHSHFDPQLLPAERTIQLPLPHDHLTQRGGPQQWQGRSWEPIGPFPAALDLFGDGSVYIVNAPGHLPGHLNLLCRIRPHRWIYLGGDACHDKRILTGEEAIGTWLDDNGATLCIHHDKKAAEQSIGRIQRLMELSHTGDEKVEVILAHDGEWYDGNQELFFPSNL